MRFLSLLALAVALLAPPSAHAQTPPKRPPCDTASVLAAAQPVFNVGFIRLGDACPAFRDAIDAWALTQSADVQRIAALIAHGAAPVVAPPAPVDTPVVVVPPPPPASSDGEPTPSGTIVLDTRAGGAQDIQKARSMADVKALWSPRGGVINDLGFTTDYNGAGKHAFRIDWRANPSGESSYNDNAFYFPSTLSALYASVVIHLGRTATGGGNGDIGSFAPVSDRGGMKRMMFLRQRDNGTDRLYWAWPTEGQRSQQNVLTIDNRNFDSYFNADYGVGQDVRWTFALIPGNPGTVRVWRNGVRVLENTKAAIGTAGFAQLQFITTRFSASQAETEYWTDLVVWRP